MKLVQWNIGSNWTVVLYRYWAGFHLWRYRTAQAGFDLHMGWLTVYKWR